jgi:predicted nuclease with TOPRIM domain
MIENLIRLSPVMLSAYCFASLTFGAFVSGFVCFKKGRAYQKMREPELIKENEALKKENGRLCVSLEDHRVFVKSLELAQHDLNERARRLM